MIEITNLTKQYPNQTTVSNLSFSVKQGEITNLLKPNDAGKSTTMRILSCFMPATSDSTQMTNLDIFKESDDIRHRIGYIPENNPLPQNIQIQEYLRFHTQ